MQWNPGLEGGGAGVGACKIWPRPQILSTYLHAGKFIAYDGE